MEFDTFDRMWRAVAARSLLGKVQFLAVLVAFGAAAGAWWLACKWQQRSHWAVRHFFGAVLGFFTFIGTIGAELATWWVPESARVSAAETSPAPLATSPPVLKAKAVLPMPTTPTSSKPAPPAQPTPPPAASPTGPMKVTKAQYGEDWPFTVPAGEVDCLSNVYAVFVTPDGQRWALNGAAKSADAVKRFAIRDVRPIWRDIGDGLKFNIGPMIDLALTRCPAATTAEQSEAEPIAAPRGPASKWYEGGTLTDANGLAWQQATPANKLASCADLLASLWINGKLAPVVATKISTVDDLKGPAAELVKGLDKAFAGSPDPKKNHQMLVNQKVADTAALILLMMKWVKTG